MSIEETDSKSQVKAGLATVEVLLLARRMEFDAINYTVWTAFMSYSSNIVGLIRIQV